MNNKSLIIYGNGQMALMLYHYLKLDYDIVAFTTDEKAIKSQNLFEIPVVPFDNLESQYSPKNFFLFVAVGFLEMNSLRVERFKAIKEKGYEVISYIHPSSSLNGCEIGENVVILENTSVHPQSSIGDCVFVGSNVNIGHDCIVESGGWINSGVGIGGSSIIGKNCFIGINSVVVNNITLSEMTYLGANSLASKTTQPGDVLISKPAELMPIKSQKFLRIIN